MQASRLQGLAIDPNYVLVREYLGEGYVAAGKVGLARRAIARDRSKMRCKLRGISGTLEVIASVN